jgi:hypothetical protein
MNFSIIPGWEIPEQHLSLRAVCSSGPGGQNVNKVSTKVQLRFAVAQNNTLNWGQKLRLQASYPSSVSTKNQKKDCAHPWFQRTQADGEEGPRPDQAESSRARRLKLLSTELSYMRVALRERYVARRTTAILLLFSASRVPA